jgi:hypothetical protein
LDIDHLAVALRVVRLARDVHSCNDDLPERRKSELFAQQCLEDVDAAISHLFQELSEIDTLEIRVLERESKTQIITGIVHRSDLVVRVDSSLGIKLKTIEMRANSAAKRSRCLRSDAPPPAPTARECLHAKRRAAIARLVWQLDESARRHDRFWLEAA